MNQVKRRILKLEAQADSKPVLPDDEEFRVLAQSGLTHEEALDLLEPEASARRQAETDKRRGAK